jgi:mannose-6-phosphate isomerase-like protein (cupin superfamily)
MEKTDKGVVLPSGFGWSDIGSWKSLYDFLEKDEKNNVIQGNVIVQDTKNSFILGHERMIATNHLNHMVVVETPDSVFVSDMDTSQDVKSIVTLLKEKRRREYHQYWTSRYSWGSRTTLEEKSGYKVERLTIYSGSMFQIKADVSTEKHLIVIQGEARITSENRDLAIKTGEPIIIIGKDSVTVENPGQEPLSLIQVETGISRQS